jgi:hypothetical protein
VLVPQRPPEPDGHVDPGGLVNVLPYRPILDWPPARLVAIPRNPVIAVPVEPDPDPIIVNSASFAIARRTHAHVEAAAVLTGVRLARADAALSARADAVGLRRPIDRGNIFVPIDIYVPSMPTPEISFTGRQPVNGAERCTLSVVNWSSFPDSFFAASPDLPPCGSNTSASRTWVDIEDADTGARLYGFCDLTSPSQLNELWFTAADGAVPANVRINLTDRRTNATRVSNVVSTTTPQPDEPPNRPVRQELVQTVLPDPFSFPERLHGYIFQGAAPTAGDNQLIRYRFAWHNTFHTYLQDASRPSVVYIFADQFKIARRRDEPYTPFATVRVSWQPDGALDEVVFDYIVAPYVDLRRLDNARSALLADPRFGATEVEFQPFLTSDVRFKIDRPVTSGSVHEERPDASVVLQGWLKDTLRMPVADFRLLFQAMQQQTASLFLGQVEIDVPNEATQVIPFVARMDDLQGEMFSYAAVARAGGNLQVTITNAIESPVDIQTLDATITRGSERVRGLLENNVLPCQHLLPGGAVQVTLAPETPMTSSTLPEVAFDLSGVRVTPDAEAIWNSILDRTTLDCFREVTVKTTAATFTAVAGHEDAQIISVLVDFEGGGTAELTAAQLEAKVRVEYPIDDVVLGRPISSTYRYAVTVVRARSQDPKTGPTEGTDPLFYVTVAN